MSLGEDRLATASSSPVDHALDELAASLGRLVAAVESGGLDHHDHGGLVTVMQRFERLRNTMALVDHRMITDAETRGLPDALTQGSMQRVLVSALRLSPGEANRRVRAAQALGPRTSMVGEPLGPYWPRLAAAQRSGEVSPEQVAIVERALARVDRRGFSPTDVDAGEGLLADNAALLGPKDLKHLADCVVDAIDPDGTLPQDRLNADRRFFHLRQTPDGAYAGEFRLTGSLGAKLAALLGPLARPRVDPEPVADGVLCPRVDPRTHGQRMHDGLEELCDRVLRDGSTSGAAGTPATVIVTITIDDLLARTGYGTTSDGALLSADQVASIAGQAEIFPAFVNGSGVALAMRRTRRIATRRQTLALIARDGGCSFPGCDRPPEWCERHHILEWILGGRTDLDNLTLLCAYHHHNFLARGWTCTINSDGLPQWRPPRWIDREQTPMINGRIMARLLAARRRADSQPQLTDPPDSGQQDAA